MSDNTAPTKFDGVRVECVPAVDVDPAHPSHYHAGGIECFDVIEALDANFNIGNVLKYIWRYKKKGGVEDLRKALTYLQREITNLGGQR